MKGLEISKMFFEQWGLPTIRKLYPELVQSIVAGRFTGSDAIGMDDELSKDHWWGPWFALYMEQAEYDKYGKMLEDELNRLAPETYEGYRLTGGGSKNVTVYCTEDYFCDIFAGKLPDCPEDWVNTGLEVETLDSRLYFLRHGSLFYDEKGYFSEIRNSLKYYPEEIRLLRFNNLTWKIAHYGEYNFCWRIKNRRDHISSAISLGNFCDAVMRICFLLENDYTPYWKWLAPKFSELPQAQVVAPLLLKLVESRDFDEQAKIILDICSYIGPILIEKKIVTENIDNPYNIPCFFMYAWDIKNRIINEKLKRFAR